MLRIHTFRWAAAAVVVASVGTLTLAQPALAAEADTQPPTKPFLYLNADGYCILDVLAWGASKDNVDDYAHITYEIFEDGRRTGATTHGISVYNTTQLGNPVGHSFQVRAIDSAGNISSLSNSVLIDGSSL